MGCKRPIMSDKIYRSEKLDLNYKIKYNALNQRRIVFEDGTNYSEKEMKSMTGKSDLIFKNVHKIKKIFNSEVL
jgi:hypothetical protein